jgi:hypothetical protein
MTETENTRYSRIYKALVARGARRLWDAKGPKMQKSSGGQAVSKLEAWLVPSAQPSAQMAPFILIIHVFPDDDGVDLFSNERADLLYHWLYYTTDPITRGE